MIFENKKLKVIEKENEQLRNQFNEAAITIERVTSGELEQSLLNENGQNNLLTENIEKLRNRLLTLSKEEKQRLWATQGLANFVDLLRGHQNGNDFYDNVISDLVKYLGANQGGLFVIEESGPNKVQLELKACYAFSRKKFLEKTILPGEGLVGNVF